MGERTLTSNAWRTIAFAAAALLWTNIASAAADCTFFVRAGSVAPEPVTGRQPTAAFATISAGVAAIHNPGEVVCVGPGLYPEGNITVRLDGTPGSTEGMSFPIEVRGDATGESTGDAPGAVRIVPPSGEPDVTTAFLIEGRQYVVIEGFDIGGFFDAGIQVRATASGVNSANITIRNNTVHDCAKSGIDVIAQDTIVVEGNTTTGNGVTGISVVMCLAPTPTGRCRGTSGVPVVPVVSNNRSGGNQSHGIFIENADGGIVQNNAVYTNDLIGISLRAAPNVVVANNLIYDNGAQGLAVGKDDLASPGLVALNNTIYGNLDWGIDIGSANAASPGATVVNSIVWRNGDGFKGIGVLNESSGTKPVRPPSVCGYVAGYNLVLDSFAEDTPVNAYHFDSDPLFVDPAGSDGVLGGERVQGVFVDRSADDNFRLRQLAGEQRTSPAVNAGSATAAEIGLTGSTASDGRADAGIIDIGFHYGASPAQAIDLPAPFMPLYVRKSGSDANGGRSPNAALASIGAAAQLTEGGITVVVGPGRYGECDVHSPSNRGTATFLADPTGALTADLPGTVLLDAEHCSNHGEPPAVGDTGFDFSDVCDVVIDGFHVGGALEDGIRVDHHSDRAQIRDNVVFGSGKRGVRVVNSDAVEVRNNLLFDNAGGAQLGGQRVSGEDAATAGSPNAVIEFNTVFDSQFNGIQVGDGVGVSSGATVRYNVTGGNQKEGIEVGDNVHRQANLVGYTTAYNLVGDRYASGVPRGEGDLLVDLAQEPLYLDPTAIVVEGDWLLDQHWRLMQTAAGQPAQSRAVDFSDQTAEEVGLADRTTRSDDMPDTGLVDRGYHYPLRRVGTVVGDCDANGVVEVNELVTAVNIALGNAPVSACVAVDADESGSVEVNELVQAVSNAVQG